VEELGSDMHADWVRILGANGQAVFCPGHADEALAKATADAATPSVADRWKREAAELNGKNQLAHELLTWSLVQLIGGTSLKEALDRYAEGAMRDAEHEAKRDKQG
jgi:hypothetical protein